MNKVGYRTKSKIEETEALIPYGNGILPPLQNDNPLDQLHNQILKQAIKRQAVNMIIDWLDSPVLLNGIENLQDDLKMLRKMYHSH